MNSRVITDGELITDDDNPDLEREFHEFADSLRQDHEAQGFIKIWRLPLDAQGNPRSNSMQQSLLCTLPMGNESIDDICARVRRDYIRPGEVRITVCVRGYQQGKRGIRFQKIMTIERENEPEAPKGNSTTSDVATMLRLIQQSNEAAQARTESFMREMMGMMARGPATPAVTTDPIAMMQQVGTMMVAFQGMFANMQGAQRPPATPGGELAGFVQQLEMMKKVNGLLGNGSNDSESGALGIIKAIGPMAAPVLQMLAAQATSKPMKRRALPQPGAPRAPTPAPTPDPSPEPVPPGATVLNEETAMKLKEALNELCDMAERGEDAVAAAALALDMLPEDDDTDAMVGALVSDPASFLPKLGLMLPRTRQFPAWFETLREEMARAYEEDPDTTNAGGGEAEED